MKRIIILSLFSISLLFSCDKKEEKSGSEKNNGLVWAENVTTIMPMERDTLWDKADFTNASNKFDREKLFNSITKAVMNGKLKAYSDFPQGELSLKDVEHILVQWDTLEVKDPETGISSIAPVKNEIGSQRIPYIQFNETIVLDTMKYEIIKKVSVVTLIEFKMTESGDIVGKRKLFDVKLN
ncbi:MAG: hypothetical protein K0S44_2329 [Bacteroidetes bacterium]|jgi:hypothetical protein|nr:hypothetical protein [Bacteroidota bacterium]